jgi:CHAD domain-containing protein
MAGTAPTLRLVPPPEGGEGWTAQAFASGRPDGLRQTLDELAESGGPAFVLSTVDEQEERWLDTPDFRILRAGLVLRRCCDASTSRARLTPLISSQPFRDDQEGFVQDLAQGPDQETVRAPGPVGSRIVSLTGDRPLAPFVTLRTRRTVFDARPAGPRLQIRLDELRAAGGEAGTATRLTIAGEEGAADRIDDLAEALRGPCGLAPAPPLTQTVFGLVGLVPAAVVDLGSETLTAQPTLQELAFVSLRREARKFLACEPAARLGDDREGVHDMRVAGRRLRAAFKLFAEALPRRGASLRRELGRFGRVLGSVRDLEVQIEHVAGWRHDNPRSDAAAFDALEAVLVHNRAAARRRMLHAFEAERYERLVSRLTLFLRSEPKRRSARLEAPTLVGKRYRAVRKAGDPLTRSSLPAEFHALRIRCKRLRYALEFYQPLYDGDVATMIQSLSSLQSLLGEHQDAWVAIVHLEELAASNRGALPRRTMFVMGRIAAQSERAASGSRRAFPKVYRKIRGRRKRALASTLKEGGASATAITSP